MDKFPNNENRTTLWILIGVLVFLVCAGAVGGTYYYVKVYKKPVAKTETKSTTVSLSDQIKEAKVVKTVGGTITEVTTGKIVVKKPDGTTAELKLLKTTSVTKGEKIENVSLASLKAGQYVVMSYNSTNQNALNIFISKE